MLDDVKEFDDEEVNKYTLFRQRNYPIAVVNKNDGLKIEITSLTKTGTLNNKKTYIGEYMAHTFLQYYSTHHFMRTEAFDLDTEKEVNGELMAKK